MVRFIPVDTLTARFGGGRLGDAPACEKDDDGTCQALGDPAAAAARLVKLGFELARRWLMDALEGADRPSELRGDAERASNAWVMGVPYPDPLADESSFPHVEPVGGPGCERLTADNLGDGMGDPRSGVRGAMIPSSCCLRRPPPP